VKIKLKFLKDDDKNHVVAYFFKNINKCLSYFSFMNSNAPKSTYIGGTYAVSFLRTIIMEKIEKVHYWEHILINMQTGVQRF
jgi:hypothetical protein